MLVGCTHSEIEEVSFIEFVEFIEFVDDLGHIVKVPVNPQRVIVASGSLARVWQLAGGILVGTTQDAFNNGIAEGNIVVNIGSLHDPNLEQILALEPDLVILSANLAGNVRLYEPLSTLGITVVYFAVDSFEDYLATLQHCANIIGRQDLAERYGTTLRLRIDKLRGQAKNETSPTILLLRASSTGIEARNSNTMAGNMLKNMQVINIADSETSLLDNLSMEVIIQEDPDFIFAVTMGTSEEDALQTLEDILFSNPAWASLSAVQNGRYIMLPRDLFHLQPNDRWAEAYEMLWEILYAN